VKLITWNTQACRGLDGAVRPERVVATARELADADVLCLQEIAVNYPGVQGGAHDDQVAALQTLLDGWQVFFGPAVDEWDAAGHRSRFGNLIATRLPPLAVQHHPLPCPADPSVISMPRLCTVLTVHAPGIGPLRIMTTHLEFYSTRQRHAQAQRLRQLHVEACALAAQPPQADEPGSPFRPKPHTAHALLCGDFNMPPTAADYALLQEPFTVPGGPGEQRLWDCWRLVHAGEPHPPTFCVHEQVYELVPLAFDFVFASDGIADRVRAVSVDARTRASDHQPVLVELA
jgi:endonuclease/exonuclease/phosphatase family metal-dependent hydrolase